MSSRRSFPFMQVDAFTDRALGGNPCAVVFDADSIDDDTRQRIAQEMNLSETAFVQQSTCADVGARYFTPDKEIPLAGHPTIATVFALFETGRLKLTGSLTRISLELQVGPIQVEVHACEGIPRRIVMAQMRPQFLASYDARDVLPVFGLAADDVLEGCRPQIVSTGTPQLMIPVNSHAALRRLRLDPEAYAELSRAGDFSAPRYSLWVAPPRPAPPSLAIWERCPAARKIHSRARPPAAWRLTCGTTASSTPPHLPPSRVIGWDGRALRRWRWWARATPSKP